MTTVSTNMTPDQIHDEIERISEERQELWHSSRMGSIPPSRKRSGSSTPASTELWQTLRMEKARLRFGEREDIVRRARAEERLERAA